MAFGTNALDSATTSMSRSFALAQSQMALSLERIASGKRFTKASQDLSGYASLITYETDQLTYERRKTDLTEAKANVNTMLDAANIMMDDLKAAKTLYADGQDTAADEIIAGIADQLTATGTDGIELVGGNWGTVTTMGTSGIDLDLSVETVATGTEANESAVDTSITNMTAYIGKLTGLLAQVESQERLAQTAVDNTEALASALTEIDEAAEMANVVDMDIRQQAAVAMVSQANIARGNLALLYR